MADINGTAGNDTLDGTDGDDVISGLAGNDILNGAVGNDVLKGGDQLNGCGPARDPDSSTGASGPIAPNLDSTICPIWTYRDMPNLG